MPTESTLASTDEHFAEFDLGRLWIVRRSDGRAKMLKGGSIASDFRASVKRFGAERTIAAYLRLAGDAEWQPLYKPGAVACEVRVDAD